MKKVVTEYQYLDKTYKVEITFKVMKNITYRYLEGTIRVSCPMNFSVQEALKHLDKVLPKLLKKTTKNNEAIDKNGMYVFGEYKYFDDCFIDVLGHKILFSDKKSFYNRVKKIVYPYFESLFRKEEAIITPQITHTLNLKDVISTYGINYIKKHIINLNISLLHYSDEIIRSVIVHELCHDYVANHSRQFYATVYKYMPNYQIEHRKLTRGIYK